MDTANSQPIRILVLGDGNHVDVIRWCKGLVHAGAYVCLASFRNTLSDFQPAYTLHSKGLIFEKVKYLRAVQEVRKIIDLERPHVVVCYYVTGYGLLGTLTGFHPIVQFAVGSDVLLAPQQFIMRQVVRFSLSRADLVATLASHLSDAATRYGATSGKVFTMPFGIELERFDPTRFPSTSNTATSLRIISTRSLYPLYRIDMLVEAVYIAKVAGVDCSLTIAGVGPLLADLQDLAIQLGISNDVAFLGYVRNSELPRLLAEHEVYVSMATSDGVSSSLLEALAMGLFPIVRANEANELWIEHNVNGILIENPEASVLAEVIRGLAFDQHLRRSARDINNKIVRERADIKTNCARYVDVFSRLSADASRA